MSHPKLSNLAHEIGKRDAFASPEQEAFLNLVRTESRLAAECERLFKSYSLSASTYNVLRILRGSGPRGATCSQIGEHLVAQVPDVTRLIDRLADAGLVERTRIAEDRRVVLIRITRKGLDLLSRLDRPTMDLHRRQLGHMSPTELGELSRLLYKARHPEAATPGAVSSSAPAAAKGKPKQSRRRPK
jgi:DNA-binding MarR family transcriptional regulator